MLGFLNRVGFTEKVFFTKHLSLMVHAGMSITDALESLRDQTKSSYFKKVLNDVLDDVKNGQQLHKALGRQPKVFDEFYVGLMEISEMSGNLETNLEFLSEQMLKTHRLKKKIKSAMMYPTFVLGLTGAIVIFMGLFILPKLADFFDSFDAKLPITTQILLWCAQIAKNYGVLIVIGMFLAMGGIGALLRVPPIRDRWHKIVLHIPVVGQIVMANQLSQMARNMGMLLRSGVPMMSALESTAKTLTNQEYKKHLEKIANDLNKGKNVGQVLQKRNYFEYPSLVSRMIGVGEKTGKLDETFIYLADYYEEEIDEQVKNITTLMEPILLAFIGFIVMFVAVSIIGPIYELTGSMD